MLIRRTFRPALVLSCTLALAATAAIAAKPAARELPDPQGWIEVRSENFRLYSNAGEAKTTRFAVSLERFRQALGRITKGLQLDSDVQTSTFVFKNDAAYTPYKLGDDGEPMNVSGYFLPRPFENLITIDASAGTEPLRVVYHEYFHAVMDASFGDLPAWVNEGLAEYFGTFRDRAGSTVVEAGHPIEGYLYELQGGSRLAWSDVFATTTDSPNYNESDRQGAFYAQAWLLVHYLGTDHERGKQLDHYLSLLRRRKADDDAFAEAFGVTRAALGAAADAADRSAYARWDLGEKDAKVTTTSRALEPAEVWFRLGDLLARQGQLATAQKHLDAAVEAGWPAAETENSLGYGALVADDNAAAEAAFRRAIEAGSTAVEPRVLLADILLGRFLESPAARKVATETPATILETRALLQDALARDAECFLALTRLASSYMAGTGDVGPGVQAIERARTLRPLEAELSQLQACLLARQGRVAEALVLVDRDLATRAPATAREARQCVASGTVLAALERVQSDDREAADQLLSAALAGIHDPATAAQLEGLRQALESGAQVMLVDAPDAGGAAADGGQLDIDRYNEAVRLGRSGKQEEALAALDALIADCANGPACEAARQSAEQLRTVVARNRVVSKFNEAVRLANAGDRKRAVELLRELEAEVTDPEMLASVQEILQALGARTKKP